MPGHWEYLMTENIVMDDEPRESARIDYKDERKLDRRYMEFPVRTGTAKTPFYIYAGDELITVFEVELVEPEEASFWTHLDLERYMGDTIRVEAPGIYQHLTGTFAFTDELHEKDTFYKEKYRPQYHFSARRGWHNDPNGMYYQDGKFHLFFQHNPYGAHALATVLAITAFNLLGDGLRVLFSGKDGGSK